MKIVRKEIGSEFWNVPVSESENGCFPDNALWFLSGRSALESIIAEIKRNNNVKSVSMPAWCCDSMVKPFVDAGLQVRFYPVYPQGNGLKQDLSSVYESDILFIMDYFGYSDDTPINDFSGIVIRDLTHSVFSNKEKSADYSFGSLRKWAGFQTGGFGWGLEMPLLPENAEYIALRYKAMQEKQRYMCGASDDKSYLETYALAEELLEVCSAAQGLEQDTFLAKRLNLEFLRGRRRENAAKLLEAFGDRAIFKELKENDCPLFVPILVPEKQRDALRRHLIQNEIYCPIHWPQTEYQHPDAKSAVLYKQELSLVCDQRYDLADMDRLIEAINTFWKD